MNELYDVLKTSKASDFLIREEQTESREAFFIGQKLDMSRAKKVTHTFLTVFVDSEDGKFRISLSVICATRPRACSSSYKVIETSSCFVGQRKQKRPLPNINLAEGEKSSRYHLCLPLPHRNDLTSAHPRVECDLIQAFSRTNRLYDQNKEYGQIVTFRSPKEYKEKINNALVLYSKGGIGQAIAEDWDTVFNDFILSLKTIRTFAPEPSDVMGLSKKQKKTFIKLFRDLDHDYAHLKSFSTFQPQMLDKFDFSQEIYEDYAAVYNNVMEELKKDPPDDTDDDPIRDDYDLVAYSKFKIDFEYIVELLQGFVEFLDQKDNEFDEVEFEHKLLQLKEIVKEFAEDNPRLSELLLQVLNEIEQDKARFMGQDVSVIINQMRYAAIDKEIEKFATKWFVPFDDVKYEAYNYKDGELANENKLKELADYALYKDTTLDALPKFKFNGALIRDFKEVLMPEISPLIES